MEEDDRETRVKKTWATHNSDKEVASNEIVDGIYMNVVLNNYRELKAAVDSGSSFSLVPEQLISKRLIKPTTHKLVAVNQTSIKIVGQTKVHCKVDDFGFEVM